MENVLFKPAQIYIVRKERNPNFSLQFSLKSVYFMRCRRKKKKKRRRKKRTKPKFEGFQSLIRIQNFFGYKRKQNENIKVYKIFHFEKYEYAEIITFISSILHTVFIRVNEHVWQIIEWYPVGVIKKRIHHQHKQESVWLALKETRLLSFPLERHHLNILQKKRAFVIT